MKYRYNFQHAITMFRYILLFVLCFDQPSKVLGQPNPHVMNCAKESNSNQSIVCLTGTINNFTDFSFVPETTEYLKIICDYDNKTITQTDLLDILFTRPKNITALEIEHCQYVHAFDELLQRLPNIRDLRLIASYFQNFSTNEKLIINPLGDNNNYEGLEKFAITGSVVKNVPTQFLCSLPNLTVLSVNDNQLQNFNGCGMKNTCCSKLQILDLSSNLLMNISFDPLILLEILQISNNNFESIDFEFGTLPKLRVLDASLNRIERISSSAFKRCNNLEEINLSGNSIFTLTNEHRLGMISNIFDSSYLPKLRVLNLANNKLRRFDYSLIPSSLHTLVLSGNPLLSISDVNGIASTLKLNSLILRDIVIHNLSNYIFTPSTELLDFRNSNLTVCSAARFANLINLKALHLDALYLEHVERFAFSSSKNFRSPVKIHLNTGIINCSCSLRDRTYEKRKHDICRTLGSVFQEIKTVDQSEHNVSHLCQTVKKCGTTMCVFQRWGCEPLHKEQWSVITDCGHLMLNDIPLNLPTGTTKLYIDGNNLTHVDLAKILRNDSTIGTLYLNGSNVRTIQFNGKNTQLEEFHLEDNYLTDVEPELWDSFKNLKHLYLQRNSLNMFNTTNQSLSQLETLHLENNFITEFPQHIIKDHDSLQRLFLQFNRLSIINNEFCSTKLEALHLENNLINNVKFDGKENIYLLRLFLQNNNISILHPTDFSCFHFLEELHLEGNNIRQIQDQSFVSLINLKNLFLDGNGLEHIQNEGFSVLNKLENLHLSNNSLKILKNLNLKHMTELKKLSLNKNKLEFFTNRILSETLKMSVLDLSQNRFQKIALYWLEDGSSIDALYLNNNQISEISGDAFMFLSDLKELHLERNRITELRGTEFKQLKSLKKLFLNNNRLHAINKWTFKYLSSLEYLTLSNNNLQNLEYWTLNFSQTIQNVNIWNNPILCDCGYVETLNNWLTKAEFVSKELKFTCSLKEKNFHLETFLLQQCDNKKSMFIVLYVGISLIVLAIAMVLFYRYRLKIELLIYSRYNVRLFYDKSMDKGKKYHAFIAYSYSDMNFVSSDLLPGLTNYKLCLHDRDFIVGMFINDNIINAIYNSCCTVLILSKKFVRSEWCRFEFKTAHHKALTDRSCRLIAILLEDINEKYMEEDMKLYLRTNTYLRWQDKQFWEKLYFALPELERNDEDIVEIPQR